MSKHPDSGRYGLTFHHLGLAASAPEAAVALLAGLGYEIGPRVSDPCQRVGLIMCRHSSMPDVEVVFPESEKGPLDGILKRGGEGLYHTCYASRDAEASVALMRKDGHRVVAVSPAQPAVLLGGRKVSFYHVAGFGLMEILEQPSEAARSRVR